MYETLVLFVQKVYTISMETSKDISDKNARKSCDFEWHGKSIGLLDLDAFFASVEQLDHPEWLGKPVIVGGSPHKRGVVSTASYEARKYGVHSAMPSATAVRLCPHAIWTSGRYDRYSEMSALVMGFLKDETPLVEQVSIDEAFFDITPGRFSKENPLEICKRIQKKVAALGITCSIGLLPTIWKEGQPVRLLGVGISSFSDEGHAKPVQASLFDQYEATFDAAASGPTTKKKPRSDLRHLSEVTDKLKDKFGADAVQYGRDLRFEHRVSDTMPTGKNEQI